LVWLQFFIITAAAATAATAAATGIIISISLLSSLRTSAMQICNGHAKQREVVAVVGLNLSDVRDRNGLGFFLTAAMPMPMPMGLTSLKISADSGPRQH
jgi:hypothetical protein